MELLARKGLLQNLSGRVHFRPSVCPHSALRYDLVQYTALMDCYPNLVISVMLTCYVEILPELDALHMLEGIQKIHICLLIDHSPIEPSDMNSGVVVPIPIYHLQRNIASRVRHDSSLTSSSRLGVNTSSHFKHVVSYTRVTSLPCFKAVRPTKDSQCARAIFHESVSREIKL